jgi:hypothetical protein
VGESTDHRERAGRWARQQARQRQLEAAQRLGWWWLILVLIVLIGVALLLRVEPDLLAGALVGALVASAVWGTAWILQAVTSSGPVLMGAEAESWTSATLRKAGPGWVAIDHVPFPADRMDVDHVLIGPGGVFAIETKWGARREASAYQRNQSATASAAAERSARKIGLLLSRVERVEVTPVVVGWEGFFEDDFDSARDGAVLQLAGSALEDWLKGLPSEGMNEDTVRSMVKIALDRIADDERYQAETNQGSILISVGPAEIAARATQALFGGLVALTITALASGLPWWGLIAVLFAVLLGAWFAQRWRRLHYVALGAFGSLLGLLGTVLIATAFVAIR